MSAIELSLCVYISNVVFDLFKDLQFEFLILLVILLICCLNFGEWDLSKQKTKNKKQKTKQNKTNNNNKSLNHVSYTKSALRCKLSQIESVREANGTLQNEVDILCEVNWITQNLSSNAARKKQWVWTPKAEATLFYFDLQNSVVRVVFLENKAMILKNFVRLLKKKMQKTMLRLNRWKKELAPWKVKLEG